MISPSFRAALRGRLAVLALAALALLGGVAPALAQDPIPPPKHSAVDANGVDLISGTMSVTSGLNSIGPNGPGGLAASKTLRPGFSISSMFSYVKLTGSSEVPEMTLVAFMGRSQQFINNPDIGPEMNEGNTLDKDDNNIVYTLADGTVARFKLVHLQYVMNPNMRPAWGVLQSVTYPSGEKLTFTYDVETIGASWMQVESSLGYVLTGSGGMHEWTAEAATNLTQGGCSDAVCSGPTFASQEALGRTPTKSATATTLTINNPAGGTPKTYTVSYSHQRGDSIVTAVSDGAGIWTYSYNQEQDQTFHPTNFLLTTTVTDPLNNKRIVKSRLENQQIISDTVGINPNGTGGKTTTFQYSSDNVYSGLGQLVRIVAPEGNAVSYVYDNQYNVIAKWNEPKPGSGLAATSMTASYNTTLCVSIKVCNRPDWIKDARGNQTDLTYDPVHGGVLTVTQPAPASGAVRPQTRYTYGQFTARYIKNGTLTAAPPVWRLTQTSTCQTLAACAGTADEVVTSYAYEPSSVANNVRLLSTTTRASDNSLSATTAVTYDARGDVITTDGPLPGAADTTRIFYDASRWKVGVVGPDPDGAGVLLYRASRTTYAADGQATSVEAGTATNQSDTALSTFVALQQGVPVYDAQRRKVSDRLVVAGTTQTRTDYEYDTAGRQVCQTVRMNPATFGSSTPACTLETAVGSYGPDRIARTDYDAANRVIKVTSGYGATAPYVLRVEKTVTYTDNGLEQTVADGKPTGTADGRGNLTTYEYDGFDRLVKVRYPNTTGIGSSTADYEQYGYDAAGNRTSRRLRGPEGYTLSYAYDAPGRVSHRGGDAPGVDYLYNNLGQQISAVYSSGGGATSATYDALGRMGSETTNGQTLTYGYDLAGRRTRITWPDSFFVTYDHDLTGAVTDVWENGGFRLAAYVHDDLGRRRALYRANSAQTYYAYDDISRLTNVTLDLVGTANDQAWSQGYNPASQIWARTSYNSLYDWSGGQASKSYTVNGLNQYATAAGATVHYDPRGNLDNDGTKAYVYDHLNQLVSAPGVSLFYEPTGRLWQTQAGATTTNFVYAGSDLVAELGNGGVLARRYVPGAGTDEPLVWYEGASNTDRRFLLTDPQGSITTVTHPDGTVETNTYDEYGIPAAGNQGRFQYTGQAWMPELGLYHYKARVYSPTLGRFLQTDPIGYKDGLNWYAYVGNDPLNNSDPTGTDEVKVGIAWGSVRVKFAVAGMPIMDKTVIFPVPQVTILTNDQTKTPDDKPTVNPDKQGKHQPGHRNFQPGKGEITHPDPQGLVDEHAGNGQQVGNTPVGEAGSKERIENSTPIGTYVDPVTGDRKETTRGIIHYGKDDVHVVPARPPETTR